MLRSGLSALPIRPTVMKCLTVFHNKILRGFLKLSSSSPVPSLYFLMGELPIDAIFHIDLLSLFYNILSNTETKLFQVAKYIMMMSDESSITWCNHVRVLCKLYSLPDPLQLLQCSPVSKAAWKTLVVTKVTVHHERSLREKAAINSNMNYLNVQLLGLSGRPHPALQNITETRQALKCRAHLQLLSGDFVTYEVIGRQQRSDQSCKLCPAAIESIQHILTECPATSETRERLLPELLNIIAGSHPNNGLLESTTTKSTLTQFLLDPTSANLSNKFRISVQHPQLQYLFTISRDWCYAVTS